MEASKLDLTISPVVFREEDHTYWLDGKELKGITSTLIHHAFPDKYKDVDEATLKQAASRGHTIHEEVEFHDRFRTMPDSTRLLNYENLKTKNGLTVIENEYLVSDEVTYASSIDIVCVNKHAEICLVDLKTTYTLDKLSTALQLSIYKRFFEAQNPGLQVAHIYALWLPQRDETIAELRELSLVDDSTLDSLFTATAEDKPFQWKDTIPDGYEELEAEYRKWSAVKDEAEKHIEEAKQRIMALMEKTKKDSIRTGYYTVSLIPGGTSRRFDSSTFKKENADLYNSYMREVATKSSLRFTTKKDSQS